MNNLVTVKNNVATTTSLIIAEQFGRKHSHVCRSIEKLKDKYGIVPISYIDSMNRPQIMYELNERQALIVMPFIGGQKSIEGQERLVDAFLSLRNMAIEKTPLERRIDALELELTSIRKTGKYEAKPQTARLTSDEDKEKCFPVILRILKDDIKTRTEIKQHARNVLPFKFMADRNNAINDVIELMLINGLLDILALKREFLLVKK